MRSLAALQRRLGKALTENTTNRTYTMSVVSQATGTDAVLAARGIIRCFSEVFGHVTVFARATILFNTGDSIFVQKSGPENHASFIYVGHAPTGNPYSTNSSDVLTTTPTASLAPTTRVFARVPTDSKTDPQISITDLNGLAYYSLQTHINEIAYQVRKIKGLNTWQSESRHSFQEQRFVFTKADLPVPSVIGDIRFVLDDHTFYMFDQTGWVASRKSPENLALGKTYTLSPSPGRSDVPLVTSISGDFSSSGGLLTDGRTGSPAQSDEYIGWFNVNPVVVLNLGSFEHTSRIRLWGMAAPDSRDLLYQPSAVLVEVSEEGAGWTRIELRSGLTALPSEKQRWYCEFVSDSYIQYIRITCTGTASTWMYLSEIEVFSYDQSAPADPTFSHVTTGVAETVTVGSVPFAASIGTYLARVPTAVSASGYSSWVTAAGASLAVTGTGTDIVTHMPYATFQYGVPMCLDGRTLTSVLPNLEYDGTFDGWIVNSDGTLDITSTGSSGGSANIIGQIPMSLDGTNLSLVLPITAIGIGWLVDNAGNLLVGQL